MNASKHPGMLAIEAALSDNGFKRRRAGTLTSELTDDVLGWIGLNTSVTAAPVGVVLVNPVMGVRHQRLERAVADLKGEKFHQYLPPSYSSPLSAVVPTVGPNDFILHGNARDADVVDRLVHAVFDGGLAFMKEFSDTTTLLDRLRSGFLHDHQMTLRYPTLLWLSGEQNAALKAVENGLQAIEGQRGPAAAELRPFLNGLKNRIEAGD